jgi:hypothetical protein
LPAEQARYYRERAGEYDDWWFRRGRYDHGPETTARWFCDVAEAHAALEYFKPTGDVLEFASGTGLWTERLLSKVTSVTAIDGSAEMLSRCGWGAYSPAHSGGAIELVINLATAAMGIGVMRAGWRFRYGLLGSG